MGKNELSEAGTSMVRDNMANFRRDTRKTRVTGYPGEKACLHTIIVSIYIQIQPNVLYNGPLPGFSKYKYLYLHSTYIEFEARL